jgi:hypothetical protein
MNFSVTRRCSAAVTPSLVLPCSAIFRLARVASWRQAGTVRPTASATASKGIWKTS